MGRTTNVKKVKRAVQLIVDQVLNNETSIVGLTTIRDYDEYTFTHSVNVCIFSVALGKKLGFGRLQLYDLGLAALLHDIGKARIPLDVLNKTTGLDEEEWQIMQPPPLARHAHAVQFLRGYEETPYRAILVAHEHHMKTDLTGYPRPIRPRKLGLYSRLVAVADGFDAATTRRSYQTVPIEPDAVLREMWENPRRGYDRDPGQGAHQPDRHLPGRHLRHSRHLRGGHRGRAQSRPDGAEPAARAHRHRHQRRRAAAAREPRRPRRRERPGRLPPLHRQGHRPRRGTASSWATTLSDRRVTAR